MDLSGSSLELGDKLALEPVSFITAIVLNVLALPVSFQIVTCYLCKSLWYHMHEFAQCTSLILVGELWPNFQEAWIFISRHGSLSVGLDLSLDINGGDLAASLSCVFEQNNSLSW